MYNDNMKTKKINTSHFNSFGSGVWRLDINSCVLGFSFCLNM